MLALGARTGDPDAALWGHLWRFDALLQAGRVRDAELELDVLAPVVDRLRQPMGWMHQLQCITALEFGRGRFGEVARLMDEVVALAGQEGVSTAARIADSVRLRIASLTGVDDPALATDPEKRGWRKPFIVLMHGELGLWHAAHGRMNDAARWYHRLPPPGSPQIPPFGDLVVEALRIELATELGDVTALEKAYRLLLPHADLHVVGGAGATTCLGSVQLSLGVAALGTGRPDAAIRHLRAAITVNDNAGFAPFATQARFALATALHTRSRPTDLDEAVGLAAEARTAAGRLSLAPLAARAADLAARLRAGGGGPLSRREAEIAELVARGLTNRQIGAAAHISERTVETHVQHVLAKLGLANRSQVAAWVTRRYDERGS
jgi:DNA-binding CsgD family transcriptional regulator